jgi:hypothetical protein
VASDEAPLPSRELTRVRIDVSVSESAVEESSGGLTLSVGVKAWADDVASSAPEGSPPDTGAATAEPPPTPQLRLSSSQADQPPVDVPLQPAGEDSWQADMRVDLRPICGEDDACAATFFVEPTPTNPVPVRMTVTAQGEAIDTTSFFLSNPSFSDDATISVRVSDGR